MRIVFNNIVAIYRKELQGYFGSPFIYIIAGVFWLMMGIIFFLILYTVGQQEAQQASMGLPFDSPSIILQSFLTTLWGLFQVFLPMLSMGLYTEERKRGTLELLATSPITNWCVALGKWLAVLTVVATLLLPLMLYEFMTFNTAKPPMNYGVMLFGHASLLLAAGAILAVGLFISSLTDSAILSVILTFAFVIFLFIVDGLASVLQGQLLAEVWGHISPSQSITTLMQGVVDGKAIILLLSYIVFGIFLTAQSIDALRFQRS
jgi:ABC-2 type transport system permease protein